MGMGDDDLNYKVIGNFESIEGSKWKEDETEIGRKFLAYTLRPAIDIMGDTDPKPMFFASTTEPMDYIYRSKKWWRTRKDEDEEIVTLPVGTRLKAVMGSRFGDIGFTNELDADNGYILRLDPFETNLTNISYEQ